MLPILSQDTILIFDEFSGFVGLWKRIYPNVLRDEAARMNFTSSIFEGPV